MVLSDLTTEIVKDRCWPVAVFQISRETDLLSKAAYKDPVCSIHPASDTYNPEILNFVDNSPTDSPAEAPN